VKHLGVLHVIEIFPLSMGRLRCCLETESETYDNEVMVAGKISLEASFANCLYNGLRVV
jgi:hypothetical protein